VCIGYCTITISTSRRLQGWLHSMNNASTISHQQRRRPCLALRHQTVSRPHQPRTAHPALVPKSWPPHPLSLNPKPYPALVPKSWPPHPAGGPAGPTSTPEPAAIGSTAVHLVVPSTTNQQQQHTVGAYCIAPTPGYLHLTASHLPSLLQ
jgi:hypothetical protein